MNRSRYIFQGIIAGLSFGTASILVRFLTLNKVDVFFIALGRLWIATIIILLISYPFLRKEYKMIFSELRRGFLRHLVLGILLGIHFMFFIAGVRDTMISNATLLVNTVPIQAFILSVIFLRSKVRKLDVIAVLLAFLGALSLSYENMGSGRLIGDIESFLAATVLALYLVLGKKIRGEYNPLASMPIIYFLASLVLVPFVASFSTSYILNYIKLDILLYLLLLGLIPTGIGHTLFYSSLKGLKPYETSIMGLLEPLGATILAIIAFGEYPYPTIFIGGPLIAIAVLITSIY